jgi:hypothetical protein
MTERDMTLEIAKEFIKKENEITSLRELLRRSWGNRLDQPWEPIVDGFLNQLLTDQKYRQRCDELESAFPASSDGDSLIRTLHNEILGRMTV